MATSRRESQPNARLSRTVKNMSPMLKPSESDQGLRRARSVPSSPDRRSSASTAAANSANACRPSSSFNPRTASSRSTSGSASSSSSSTHGKSTLLHSVSAMVGAKQAAGAMRRRADKSAGDTSVWPHALATTSATSQNKDPASKAAKSPASNLQKGKLSTRPGAEKAVAAVAVSSPKPKTQKAATGAGKTLTASSSARNPGATAKRRTGLEISVPSIQRTTSVPVAALKAEEQDVQLLMEEFDEMESISTPSIEEHLQQRLPDPVDVTAYATSEDKSDQEAATEHMFSEEKHEDLNEGSNADAGLDRVVEVMEETELKEATNEAESNKAATETGSKESVDETDLNDTVGAIELKGPVDEPMLNEAGSETQVKSAELEVKEEAKANEEMIVLPVTRTAESVQRWRKDDESSNEVTEEGRSKTSIQERRNKVMALVGRFETVMSGRE